MRRLLITLYALILAVLANHAVAVTLSLQPASQTAMPGDTVTLDLVIDGLGDFASDSLGAFDIDIAYDTSVLTFSGYTLGPYLGDVSLSEAVDFSLGDSGGTVNITELSLLENDDVSCFFCIPPYLDEIQPGSFTLASLDFTVDVLDPGASTIVAIDTVNALGDGFGAALTVESTTDAVINAVPVPAAVWLFGSGLIGLIGLARRKQSA
jgi:hypothetical protein